MNEGNDEWAQQQDGWNRFFSWNGIGSGNALMRNRKYYSLEMDITLKKKKSFNYMI